MNENPFVNPYRSDNRGDRMGFFFLIHLDMRKSKMTIENFTVDLNADEMITLKVTKTAQKFYDVLDPGVIYELIVNTQTVRIEPDQLRELGNLFLQFAPREFDLEQHNKNLEFVDQFLKNRQITITPETDPDLIIHLGKKLAKGKTA